MATKEELLQRRQRIHDLFASIAAHADQQASWRCPYRNRGDRCTARFGCRNQRQPTAQGELRHCGGDHRLDYRPAWEQPSEPETPR